MNILFLGYTDSPLIDFIRAGGDYVDTHANRICDFLVSYGHRHILSKDILDRFPNRAINLHISYLPWNRGADPNLWSWIDGTPKGVTIHHLDEGIDTGDIIAQRLVTFGPGETLASSYAKLRAELDDLFREWWPAIRAGTAPRTPQPRETRRSKHRIDVEHLMTRGWETPVTELTGLSSRASAA